MQDLTPTLLLAAALFAAQPAAALELPAPAVLQAGLATKAQTIEVLEPHLSSGQRQVRYLGYPAPQLLDHVLGPLWREDAEQEIELRALDGFVSRIPVARFLKYSAFLVVARADGAAFQVDNHLQNEKAVWLAPYYLVWDNLRSPELQAEGGALWPYQVAQISLRPSSRAALLPGQMGKRWAQQAAWVQKYCLSCHQVNGYGGDKMPLNLAQRARQIEAAEWQRLLLSPTSVRPGSTMPALPDSFSPATRASVAAQLHDYLKALPLAP
nr:hypothetical protein [uncultured Roseateles sp.]